MRWLTAWVERQARARWERCNAADLAYADMLEEGGDVAQAEVWRARVAARIGRMGG